MCYALKVADLIHHKTSSVLYSIFIVDLKQGLSFAGPKTRNCKVEKIVPIE